jgi:hypothetical protein
MLVAMDETQTLRQAKPADVPRVRAVVNAAYARYLPRMDRPPGPMLDDYAAAAEGGALWVASVSPKSAAAPRMDTAASSWRSDSGADRR